ncbi:MAG: sialidase family protein [Wenzhouxiangellaceae bacterium]
MLRWFATLWLVAFSALGWAGSGVWTSSGPDGGRVWDMAASPFISGEFYAAGGGGVFKSVDSGATWSAVNAGINRRVFSIAHSHVSANRLMASGSTKVFYTDNGATTWQDRTPSAALLSGSFVFRPVSGRTPGTWYLALGDGRILIATDSGLTWSAAPAIPETAPFSISAIESDPVSPGEVLVATTGSTSALWRGNLNSAAPAPVWTGITSCGMSCPWSSSWVRDIAFGSGNRVWLTTIVNTARSDDNGATWIVPAALNGVGGSSISVRPGNNAEVYIAGNVGMHYTTDDGATVTQILAGLIGNDLSQPVTTTVVVHNPFNPGFQVVGTDTNGPYRRTSTALDVFAQSTAGFRAQNIRAVARNTLNRVHIGASDNFGAAFVSWRSPDNGLTWSQTNGGLAADQFRALVVDPNDPNRVYAAGRFIPKLDDTGTMQPGNGGIYKSTDSGSTWTTIDSGIPMSGSGSSLFGTVRDLAIDDTSVGMGGGSQILYATGSGRLRDDGMGGAIVDAARVYKSVDAGATWTPSDSGVGGVEVMPSMQHVYASGVQIVIDPTDPLRQTLYLATFIGRGETDVPTTIQNGVFKSTNGGATWTNVVNGLPKIAGNPAAAAQDVLSLAIDPTDPTGQTLYASTNDLNNSVLGSVYKTTDGGNNWFFAGTGLAGRDVRDLIVDPLTGDVYAAIADPLGNGDGGVFVSEDGGLSWASISTGFPATAVPLKLELDNTGANLLIHAGTTGGLYSFEQLPDGDTDGAPDAVEDTAPAPARGPLPSGDGNGDGILDRVQTDVASPKVLVGTRGNEVTLTASVEPAFAGAGACDRIENSFGMDQLPTIPFEQQHDLPYNGLYLRIPDCSSARITMVYHSRSFADDPTWQIRGWGLDFPDEESVVWHRIDGATVTGAQWTFVIDDGDVGDNTPVDDVIVFIGGAKRLTERFFSDGLEAE